MGSSKIVVHGGERAKGGEKKTNSCRSPEAVGEISVDTSAPGRLAARVPKMFAQDYGSYYDYRRRRRPSTTAVTETRLSPKNLMTAPPTNTRRIKTAYG